VLFATICKSVIYNYFEAIVVLRLLFKKFGLLFE